MQAVSLAAHRMGFSETSLQAVQGDPRGWVLAQFTRPAPLDANGLIGSAEAGAMTRRVLRASAPATEAAGSTDRAELRRASVEALQRRWQHVVATPTPVFERWVMFWSNHFSVSATKATTLGLVWPYEREAIRPHATGRFKDLLRSATLHPAMLLYLDNAQSIGPDSRAGRRREKGLNENLARELLELHTLGVRGGYSQADVTELARLLTGWTISRDGRFAPVFTAAMHQPGPKRVLGRTYPEGPDAVDALFTDLARLPSTARFIATKLARHFVTDEPPAALVDAVAARFSATDGDLRAVADALFSHPLAWTADAPAKYKRPEELLLSAHRALKLPVMQAERLYLTLTHMGQPVGRAPSPQGWPDRSEDWLAPDAVWKRVEGASAFAAENADMADARQLAALSLGRDLGRDTRQQIDRADSSGQALALWLVSPEFQRR